MFFGTEIIPSRDVSKFDKGKKSLVSHFLFIFIKEIIQKGGQLIQDGILSWNIDWVYTMLAEMILEPSPVSLPQDTLIL
jgi:hypothetical protein